MHQLEDNLNAVQVQLSNEELAQLQAMTPLAPVYPHWFTQNLPDQPVVQALS
jgi:hypothetical protein